MVRVSNSWVNAALRALRAQRPRPYAGRDISLRRYLENVNQLGFQEDIVRRSSV
ncbi:hypothetical protein QE374_002812 [Microbacterium sp. SORGH_AS428]|nr:hypothetical protein [Microbacterium sp. SORGH_AS_0428]